MWPIFARVSQAEKAIKKLIEETAGVYHVPDSGPGPQYVIEGNRINGFFGEVSANQLISGDDLASEIGLTAGTAFNSDAGWLKVVYREKVLFVAKKPFRYELSWEDIYDVGAIGELAEPYNGTVAQDAEVTINGDTYRVRLLKGGEDDTEADKEGAYGRNEWNTIMYSLVSCADDGHLGAMIGQLWASYSNDDVGIGGESGPDGKAIWCQETDPDDSSRRVRRGFARVSDWITSSSDSSRTSRGWRPVLQLID